MFPRQHWPCVDSNVPCTRLASLSTRWLSSLTRFLGWFLNNCLPHPGLHPDAFPSSNGIRQLDLRGTHLTAVTFRALARLPALQTLQLSEESKSKSKSSRFLRYVDVDAFGQSHINIIITSLPFCTMAPKQSGFQMYFFSQHHWCPGQNTSRIQYKEV